MRHMPKTYEYESCSKKYTTDSGLRRPCRKYTEHRPQDGDIVVPTKELVQRFLMLLTSTSSVESDNFLIV